jgi:hypothetical protein
VAAIVPPVVSAATEPVSRVADAVDVVVVVAVAVVVVVARVKALWARRRTAVPKAAENASTRIRHSVVKGKVTVVASRWQTATIISTSTTVTTTTRTRIIRTDRLTSASSAIRADRTRADSEMRKQTAGLSRPSAPRWSPASRRNLASPTSRVKPASRRSSVNRASLGKRVKLGSLVSHANLGKLVNPGKTVSLGQTVNRASHAQSSTNHNSMRARSSASHSNTIRSLVKARVRQSSHLSIPVRRPPRPVRHDPRSRLLFGPRPRQAIDTTSKAG